MQLSKIKIAGFKTFVDPVTITLPSKLVAIVGPNGCGKSNIIDAVTWVMGESSPKYLRGEASTDVIFNGSSARKPVGLASVELIFDNSDGTIGGEFATFAEISIKRSINRESDSTYYLNGTRCRKRDVVDLFLGTGLGPRSYSIIGQNMINRIIEAKPEELRNYLEEAAGISKYKERRHETELRISHTKDNLARVFDLRAELEKQLSHLKHQANVAEKFKNLKEQERLLRAELYAVEWRQLDSRMVDYTLQIQREETALEARNSEHSKTDRELEQLRHEQRVANDSFQEVQRKYYAIGNEITRIEQEIMHHKERQQQWENDLKQSETDWQSLKDQMHEAEDTSAEIEKEIQTLTPELTAMRDTVVSLQVDLNAAEETMQESQSRWEDFNQISAKTNQTAQVEKTRLQHLEQRIQSLEKRKHQLEEEQQRLNFTDLSKEIDDFSKLAYEITDRLAYQTEQLGTVKSEISQLETSRHDSTKMLDTVKNDLQRLRGQQASLDALQQTALGQRDNPASPWVMKHDLAKQPRLAQFIAVENGWEFAVEKVLGFYLQAICVEDREALLKELEDFKDGNICLYQCVEQQTPKSNQQTDATPITSIIKSSMPLSTLVEGVYIANSLEEAIRLCESLGDTESVITKEGVWLNKAWVKILREEDPAAGVFQREQELKSLAERISSQEQIQTDLESNIESRKNQIEELIAKRDRLQQNYNQQQAESIQLNTQQKAKQERLSEMKAQSERFMRDFDECGAELSKAQSELIQTRTLLNDASQELEKQNQARHLLLNERDAARNQLHQMRNELNQKKEAMHELEIRLETAKSQKTSLMQNVAQLNQRLGHLNERKITLQSELSAMQSMETLSKSLTRALDKHVSIEGELNTTRVAVEALEHEFRNLEDKRQIIEREINKVRNHLEKLRVEWQGWKVKADTIIEQLKQTEFTLSDILKDLQQDISLADWQAKLDQVVQRINRLGAINLVAIDEYQICLERKEYLDKQIDDLQSGLKTLEEAIAKIDQETKNRFKETFDTVNARFQELFPTVFGGGKAYLELTEDNLLEAGVSVMACPPGKRNSSIYLLSGGEKSLTALALIFSIFYLNPAPFCLLDEVDAALDDANVLRFTRLVKSMADRTQFLFISHNKITIEMAQHLIGVTMNEPGVSRLVSVDIEKAMALAGVEDDDQGAVASNV